MNVLDPIFKRNETDILYSLFKQFESFERGDKSISEYIVEFERIYNLLKNKDMALPEAVLAFKLLEKAGLDTKEKQLALTACNVINFESMKSALRRIFGQSSNSDFDGDIEIKQEVFYNKYQRNSKNKNSFVRNSTYKDTVQKGTNPLDRQGRRTKCAVCSSTFHWAKDCPHKDVKFDDEENLDDCMYIQQSQQHSYGFLTESFGAAILDTACTNTVCGTQWLFDYIKSLSSKEKTQIFEKNSDRLFRFGDGSKVKALKNVVIPATIGDKHCKISTDVVDLELPLLLSKASLKKANAVIDFENDKVTMFGQNIKLLQTSSGHYSVNLRNNKKTEDSNVLVVLGEIDTKDKETAVKKLGHASKQMLGDLLKEANVQDKETSELFTSPKRKQPKPKKSWMQESYLEFRDFPMVSLQPSPFISNKSDNTMTLSMFSPTYRCPTTSEVDSCKKSSSKNMSLVCSLEKSLKSQNVSQYEKDDSDEKKPIVGKQLFSIETQKEQHEEIEKEIDVHKFEETTDNPDMINVVKTMIESHMSNAKASDCVENDEYKSPKTEWKANKSIESEYKSPFKERKATPKGCNSKLEDLEKGQNFDIEQAETLSNYVCKNEKQSLIFESEVQVNRMFTINQRNKIQKKIETQIDSGETEPKVEKFEDNQDVAHIVSKNDSCVIEKTNEESPVKISHNPKSRKARTEKRNQRLSNLFKETVRQYEEIMVIKNCPEQNIMKTGKAAEKENELKGEQAYMTRSLSFEDDNIANSVRKKSRSCRMFVHEGLYAGNGDEIYLRPELSIILNKAEHVKVMNRSVMSEQSDETAESENDSSKTLTKKNKVIKYVNEKVILKSKRIESPEMRVYSDSSVGNLQSSNTQGRSFDKSITPLSWSSKKLTRVIRNSVSTEDQLTKKDVSPLRLLSALEKGKLM